MSALHLRNIEPEAEEWLRRVGVTSRNDIVSAGPGAVYKKLLLSGYQPDENFLWKLIGAAEDKTWQEVVSQAR